MGRFIPFQPPLLYLNGHITKALSSHLRWAATNGFKEGSTTEEIARKTYWAVKRIERLREWYVEKYGPNSTMPSGKKAESSVHSAENSTMSIPKPDSITANAAPLKATLPDDKKSATEASAEFVIHDHNKDVNEAATGDTNNAEKSAQKLEAPNAAPDTASPVPLANPFATSSKHNSTQKNSQIWAHFYRLVDLILKLETAQNNERPQIMADIQRELTQIGDSKLDELLMPFFNLMDLHEDFGSTVTRGDIDITLPKLREHMNRKYKRS